MKPLAIATLASVLCSSTVSAQQLAETNKPSINNLPKRIYSLSKEDIAKKIAAASSAEYKGSVAIEDLATTHDQYQGKVIELEFCAQFLSTSGKNPYLFITGKRGSIDAQLFLYGQASLEWAVEKDKAGGVSGTSSKIYALVENDAFIALGTKKKKTDDGYVYAFGNIATSSGVNSSDTQDSESKPALDLSRISQDELEKKITAASSAEYKGRVTTEDLIIKHTRYLGKVVELKFSYASLKKSSLGESQYLYVSGGASAGSQRLYLCGQEALEWAADASKKPYGSLGTVYALVEGNGLIALGSRKRSEGNGYSYRW